MSKFRIKYTYHMIGRTIKYSYAIVDETGKVCASEGGFFNRRFCKKQAEISLRELQMEGKQ